MKTKQTILDEFRKFWLTHIFPQKGNVIGVKIKQSDKESNLEDVKKYGKKFEDFLSKALNEQREEMIKEIETTRNKYDQDDMIKYEALDDIIKKIKEL